MREISVVLKVKAKCANGHVSVIDFTIENSSAILRNIEIWLEDAVGILEAEECPDCPAKRHLEVV